LYIEVIKAVQLHVLIRILLEAKTFAKHPTTESIVLFILVSGMETINAMQLAIQVNLYLDINVIIHAHKMHSLSLRLIIHVFLRVCIVYINLYLVKSSAQQFVHFLLD